MLGDRHQLDVREALGHNVFGELFGQLAIAQAGPPRHQVHLVGAHRLEHRILQRARWAIQSSSLPRVVALRHLRRRLRRHLGGERHRVGAVGDRAVGAVHPELVQAADLEAGPEHLPHPGRAEHAQLRLVAVPVVELTDQADALGIRRPHRERDAVDDAVGRGEAARMRAKNLPQSLVATLGEQVQIDLAERGQEAVGIGDGVGDGCAVRAGIADLEPVVRQIRERHRDREKARLDVLEDIAFIADDRRHLDRVRSIGADHGVIAVLVGAQNRMRVVVFAGQQAVEVGRVRPQMRTGELGWSASFSSLPTQ